MPISASQAWREAAASVTKEPMLLTMELQNPAFVEDGLEVPIRVVADTQDHTFRIEGSADVNPGDDVLWTAVPFDYDPPKIGQGGGAEWRVRVDNIGREVSKYLADAVELQSEIVVIVRGYLPSRPTEVGFGPFRGVAKTVRVLGPSAEMNVVIADPYDRKFGREVYDMVRFPSLLAVTL